MSIAVDLWRWRLDRPDPADLAPEEMARADRFVFARDRDRFIAARAGLRLILGRTLGIAAARVAFDYGPHGKPRVAGPAFNLSHSGDMAALAVAAPPDLALGLDIEAVRPIGMEVARAHFSPAEVRALEATPPGARVAAFHRLWTRKEAWLKARGTGLSEDTRAFTVTQDAQDARLTRCADDDPAAWSLHDIAPAPGMAGALALRAEGRAVTLRWRGEAAGARTAHRT